MLYWNLWQTNARLYTYGHRDNNRRCVAYWGAHLYSSPCPVGKLSWAQMLLNSVPRSVRSSSTMGKDDWIEACVADNFFNVSSKFNLCFLRKHRKWKMLSDTKRMLLFLPLRSLGLINNAYCYKLFHPSYISELRVELYRHLFHDWFCQRMVQTGKQLTISGWKNYQHVPSIYLHL